MDAAQGRCLSTKGLRASESRAGPLMIPKAGQPDYCLWPARGRAVRYGSSFEATACCMPTAFFMNS